ncbi:OmpH family outer membrane protein [Marinobacter panjinensis]|uniref:OmpH family outer membrane protein n=1 Tax=Marinobacter panjinensis TaxID=2576384 RepID=A0A4U6QUQ5_9GAMM|nr:MULTISPECIES: OmpH family outer membrane protein [Marinobacter]MCR8915241.1 OmpH family outer membrane protein [Marinobacter panjinensis]MDK8464977.1 OmpH family outer membrane protein [Marinobacter sp. SS13-12]TKV64459.1 OmpH family outer membrane protein [Marinobacter panjinensis]
MFRLSMAVLLAALMATTTVAAETRIGVVDLRQALFSSKDAKAFSEQMQRDFSAEEAKVREAQEAARNLQARLEKDGAMMNESERTKMTAEFQEKVKEFNFLKQRLDSTVANRKQQFLEDARPEVDAAVKELLDEHDLDLILPSEAVVYVKPDMNLTEELLEKLDR